MNIPIEELGALGLTDGCPTRIRKPGHWLDPVREPSTDDKRIMIVEAIRICLKFIMKNHLYTFNNRVLRQQQGGPIGLDLTGTVAQIFMIWWELELRTRLEYVNLLFLMQKRYVDDVNLAATAVEPGTIYTYGTFTVEASRDELGADARTMEFIKSIGNSIHYSVQLEIDCPSRHQDRKMPILDLKCWVERNATESRILHEHYKKDVSSKSVTHAD